MINFQWVMTLIGALIVPLSDVGHGDLGGVIFGLMVVLSSATIVISELFRRMDAVTYKLKIPQEVMSARVHPARNE